MEDDQIHVKFDLVNDSNIRRFRIDPSSEGMFALQNIRISLWNQKKLIGQMSEKQIWDTNGLKEGKRILFLADHPMMAFDSGEELKVDKITFSAEVTYSCSPSLLRIVQQQSAEERWIMENRKKSHLYLDTGAGFSEKECYLYEPSFQGDHLLAEFDLEDKADKEVYQIRSNGSGNGLAGSSADRDGLFG